jgi:hypothetical protein
MVPAHSIFCMEMATQEYAIRFAMQAAEATNSSATKRVVEMITQENVTRFVVQAAEATNSSAVKHVAEMVMQENVTRVVVQAAETTNTLAIFGRLHEKSKVDRNTFIALPRRSPGARR